MKENTIKRICLWSGPRNVSTALMYSFAHRSDCQVYDEPLYAHYLSKSKAKAYHPGSEEILATMENDGNKVVKMMMGDHQKPVAFFKNMTHHLLDLDRSFMKDVVNVFLTRDPEEMLTSFVKVIKNPTMTDVGYELHTELLDYLNESNIEPVVLDSENILRDPEGVLKKLCTLAEIPFEKSMLSWEPGPLPEDGVWAKYWYDSIHKSSGFKPFTKKNEALPKHLEPLLHACRPHYERLAKMAIK